MELASNDFVAVQLVVVEVGGDDCCRGGTKKTGRLCTTVNLVGPDGKLPSSLRIRDWAVVILAVTAVTVRCSSIIIIFNSAE